MKSAICASLQVQWLIESTTDMEREVLLFFRSTLAEVFEQVVDDKM